MTVEEFVALPERQRAEIIAKVFGERLAAIPVPPRILPPKYDARFSRGKGVYCFMSEMTLNDLRYWHAKKLESAKSGSKWAETDGKTAATMERWIKWRECYPNEQWWGERGDTKVTAASPSREPRLHNWSDSQRRSTQSDTSSSSDGYDDPPPMAADDYGPEDMGDIPF